MLSKLPSPMLVDAGDQPALYLSSEPGAAQIGYLSEHVPLQLIGRARDGRVPVRIEGALRTRGFVDERMLALRVQRRGRLRGTPLYVGPDDVVLVTGSSGQRVNVHAQARLHGQPFGAAYDGSYPLEGLAAQAAPVESPRPEPGVIYTVPANVVVPLFEAPGSSAVGELPAEHEAYTVQVVNRAESWLAVRAGEGPYLIGWTNAALLPASAPTPSAPAPTPTVEAPPIAAPPAEAPPLAAPPLAAPPIEGVAEVAAPLAAPVLPPPSTADAALDAVNGVRLPVLLANEPGALKRVAAGTKVVFGDAVIGVLKRDGYARVVQAYEQAGYADVFVAANDDVALRGLVRAVDLSDAPPVNETAKPVATR